MKRWLTVGVTGAGTCKDPRRPNLNGKDREYSVVADGGAEALIKLVEPGGLFSIVGDVGITHHGDEAYEPAYTWEEVVQPAVYDENGELVSAGVIETRNGQKVYRVKEDLLAVLQGEAKRLGLEASEWDARGYDVGVGGVS